MKRRLHIDLETFSSVDLKKAGIYKYVESNDFSILLLGYAFDDNPVQYVDLDNKGSLPKEVVKAITDATVVKKAWNALFEITCLEKYLEVELDITQWECTMIGATMIGLPASLAQAGLSLNLDTTKDAAGKNLIKLFCLPVKEKTTANGKLFSEPRRNTKQTHPDKWQAFVNYLITDVEQERKIERKIAPYVQKAFTNDEKLIWWIDYAINKRGVLVDSQFALKCIELAEEQKEKCLTEAIKLTKLNNPNSTAQIKGWLEAAIGESIESLNKKFIPGIKRKAIDSVTERVIELRQELSKSSVKKYSAIIESVSTDGRIRGLHRYFGAQKTGRWSSSMVQIHNLKRNELANLEAARETVYKYGLFELEAFFEEAPQEILSQLIRTAFIAKPNHSLIMADFSAIEARITAWLAGEKWRMDIFNGDGKIYEASAAHMFKVPIKEVTKGSEYRAKGKIAELALGFGGGVEALKRMGGEDMGLKESEMKSIVKVWRLASPKIPQYWKAIEEAAIKAVKLKGTKVTRGNVSFQMEGNILWLCLPSGRYIAYREPKIEEKFVPALDAYTDTLTYIGMEQTKQTITRLSTYGGKLTENIVQGTARDLLAASLLRLNNYKFNVVLHVHDEVVCEVSDKNLASSVLKINKIMEQQPEWAKGLPLTVDSTVSKFYKK